jgi:hypothetical protein
MKNYTIHHLYIPSPSPFWDELRDKYKGKLSSVIRAVVEAHENELIGEEENNETHIELMIGGVRYAGELKRI